MPIRRYLEVGIFTPKTISAMGQALEATAQILGIGNDPSPAASLPSRLPFRSYIFAPTRTAILTPLRQTPPNDGDDLRCNRIENDVLGKDEILSHGFCLEDDGLAAKPLAS